jgi:hypothetical protein
VTFLTDGGEEVRALTELVTPEAEHVLDWFHITMRLTVLGQYARGVAHHDEAEGARLLTTLDSIKWLLWHGNQHRAGKGDRVFRRRRGRAGDGLPESRQVRARRA